MFYEALDDYDICQWGIDPMPTGVNTYKQALKREEKRDWPFQIHNGKGM
jgi:hypothetical protein